jgi:probable phosphoglycerate mutase
VIDLIVVRHGETDWNRVRRFQGHTDIALNAVGIDQAVRLAAALVHEPIAAIHASDLARARATAEPVAAGLGLPVIVDPRLRERQYGILEGLTFDELVAAHPEEARRMSARDPQHAIPGGESQHAFSARVVDAVLSIAGDAEARHGNAAALLVVTHGGVLDMLYRAAEGIRLDAERPCPIPNAVINRLRCDGGRLRLVAWAVPT